MSIIGAESNRAPLATLHRSRDEFLARRAASLGTSVGRLLLLTWIVRGVVLLLIATLLFGLPPGVAAGLGFSLPILFAAAWVLAAVGLRRRHGR